MVRQCFLTGELVFFAEERARRPQNLNKANVSSANSDKCPFCLKNYSMTPKATFETPDKKIRIIPNKYPFVSRNDLSGYGIHEVVIDTSNHSEKLYEFNNEHIGEVINSIKNRVDILQNDDKITYVQVFKNDGIDAGASQPHSHWQIAALSVLPPKYMGIKNVLKKYYNDNNKCYFCNLKSLLREDLKGQLIDENQYFISYVPIDARFPYEMYIIPKRHISNIIDLNIMEIKNLGKIIRDCAKRLFIACNGISYNICVFNSPKPDLNTESDNFNDYFHFYVEIIPRIGRMAGFEFSTGCYINSVLPEKSAEILKNTNINQRC